MIINASFDKHFIKYKNIMCVFDCKVERCEFALILSNENICDKITKTISPKNTQQEIQGVFEEKFLLPIISEIGRNKNIEMELKLFVKNVVQFLDTLQRQRLLNLMKDKNLDECFTKEIFGNYYSNTGNENQDDSNQQYNGDNSEKHLGESERSYDSKNSVDNQPPKKKRKFQKTNMDRKIIEAPNFKIFSYKHIGIQKLKLVIFFPANTNLCHEYSWDNNLKCFVCIGCSAQKRQITAFKSKHSNGKEYILLSQLEHVCILREFDSQKFFDDIILKKPDYEIIERNVYGITQKYIFIFVGPDKKYCYKFRQQKSGKKSTYFVCPNCVHKYTHISAYICYDDDKNEEYISLKNRKHICEPIKFEPEKYLTPKIIYPPNYQLIKRKTNGRIVQRLVIFDKNDKDFGYEYTWNAKRNHFKCNPCHSKHKIFVSAKLVTTENDDEKTEYVQLGRAEHKCEPRKFVPEKIDYEIVKQNDFKMDNFLGNLCEHITIFLPNVKSLCYSYSKEPTKNTFICNGCKRMKKYANAKLCEDKNGEKYLKLNDTEHICKPQKYNPNKFSLRIIENQNFKIETIFKNGDQRKYLSLFTSSDKKCFYRYFFCNSKKWFICCGCRKQKKTVTARLKQDKDGKEYIQLAPKDHVCSPETQI
uniref:Transposase n=1 Tax=Panagrolaimus sp. ES5 TaxID=591445 RepID=A0AC34FSS7_9BILA